MLFKVDSIEFDFDMDNGHIPKAEQKEITESFLSVWEANDEEDLIEEITSASGWCIKNIDYSIVLS
jgi:hypothetical protein